MYSLNVIFMLQFRKKDHYYHLLFLNISIGSSPGGNGTLVTSIDQYSVCRTEAYIRAKIRMEEAQLTNIGTAYRCREDESLIANKVRNETKPIQEAIYGNSSAHVSLIIPKPSNVLILSSLFFGLTLSLTCVSICPWLLNITW